MSTKDARRGLQQLTDVFESCDGSAWSPMAVMMRDALLQQGHDVLAAQAQTEALEQATKQTIEAYAVEHDIDQTTSYVDVVAEAVEHVSDLKPLARQSIVNLMRYIEEHEWQGGCHAISSVLYVLLRECGVDAQLCIGEVRCGDLPTFDHSWATVADEIYDLTCGISIVSNTRIFGPVIAGVDVSTQEPTRVEYGIDGVGLDPQAEVVRKMRFGMYMDAYPESKNGLWDVVRACLPFYRDVRPLRMQYGCTQRVYVN